MIGASFYTTCVVTNIKGKSTKKSKQHRQDIGREAAVEPHSISSHIVQNSVHIGKP